ncbi:gamma-secretase aspartyl protease complex, presenilin enhancer-2 subunit [Gorgonomyces haynaldii]|nr:gamma-secretase aspartyl protease complex, presenilin enhancer-2 subunit [Gorgonomyces haynaldii]
MTDKLSDAQLLKITRTFFYAGFCFLPFFWLVNVVWLYNVSLKRQFIRKYIIWSGIGSLCWILIIGVWLGVYLQKRLLWGEFGDKLTVFVPIG